MKLKIDAYTIFIKVFYKKKLQMTSFLEHSANSAVEYKKSINHLFYLI